MNGKSVASERILSLHARNFKKVLISLRDTNDMPSSCHEFPVANAAAARVREGRPDRSTLPCTGSSILKMVETDSVAQTVSGNFKARLILPHALFDLSRFRA